jgi:hypothetical protein
MYDPAAVSSDPIPEPPMPISSSSSNVAANLNLDEILELCADYERQIDEEQVRGNDIFLPNDFF